MRRLPFVLAVLTLAACSQGIQPSQDSNDVADATGVFAAVQAGAPDIDWSAPEPAITATVITIDDEHTIPAGALQTTDVTAVLTPDEYANEFSDLRETLTSSLNSQGWETHSSLDADGPTGTQWGYRRSSQAGVQFLILGANGTDCETSQEAPVECPMYEASATLTSPLPADADL